MKRQIKKGTVLVYTLVLVVLGVFMATVVLNVAVELSSQYDESKLEVSLVSNMKTKSDLAMKYARKINKSGSGFIDNISCPQNITLSGATQITTGINTALRYLSGSIICLAENAHSSEDLKIYFNEDYTDIRFSEFRGFQILTNSGSLSGTFSDIDSTNIDIGSAAYFSPDGIDDNFDSDDYSAYASTEEQKLNYRLLNVTSSRDRGAPNILNRDFVYGNNIGFELQFEIPTPIIVETIIGDNSYARNGVLTLDGDSQVFSTTPGVFQTLVHTPSISENYIINSVGSSVSITYITVKDVDSGKILARFDFGTDTSQLETGFIKVTHGHTSFNEINVSVIYKSLYPDNYSDDDDISRRMAYGYVLEDSGFFNILWSNSQINNYIEKNPLNNHSLYAKLGDVSNGNIYLDIDTNYRLVLYEINKNVYNESKELVIDASYFGTGQLANIGYLQDDMTLSPVKNADTFSFDFTSKDYALFIENTTTSGALLYKMKGEDAVTGSGIYIQPLNDSDPSLFSYLGYHVLVDNEGRLIADMLETFGLK